MDEKELGFKSWISGPKRKEVASKVEHENILSFNSHRVAVLPFASLSPNPEDEYFADGMTEEVISTLSRVPEIEVISRTSIMQYKKNPKPIKEVSRDLEVGTVLEGGVRKSGNTVRITVQMIDAHKDRPLWAESYDRNARDVFAIQSEVASRVAGALVIKSRTGNSPSLRKNPTNSPEAYTLYLKGRYHWNKRAPDDVKTALDYFEQALKEDPSFALGYLGIADCSEILVSWSIDRHANHEKANAMVAKALHLDPDLAEAHGTRGLLLTDEFRLKDAEVEFREALRLNPSYAPVHLWYFLLLLGQLRWDEALEHIQKAVDLDPLSANMHLNFGSYYFAKRDYSKALIMDKRASNLDPAFAPAHIYTGVVYGKMQMFDEAKREFELAGKLVQKQCPHVSNSIELWLAYFHNDKERVRILLPRIEENPEAACADATDVALMNFFLGENDRGFDWLERAYSDRVYGLHLIQISEISDYAKLDPRYDNFLKKLGLN